MIELYDYELSGNCYKIRLMLSFLKLDYLSKKIELRETLREINVGDFTGMPVGQTYSLNNTSSNL